MNKTQKNVKKGFAKKVFHLILPVVQWKKFDDWAAKKGFATRTEAVRYLIRNMT